MAIVNGSAFLISISNMLFINVSKFCADLFRLKTKSEKEFTIIRLTFYSVFLNTSIITLIMYAEFFNFNKEKDSFFSITNNIIA